MQRSVSHLLDSSEEIGRINREMQQIILDEKRLVDAVTSEKRAPSRSEATELKDLEVRFDRLREEKLEWEQRRLDESGTRTISDDGWERSEASLRTSVGRERDRESDTRGGLASWFAAEFRALAEGSGSGAYVVPEHYSSTIIDRLRAEAVGLRSGFRLVTTDTDTLHVPKLTADAAAAWTAEAAAITPSDPTFSENIASPKKLAALVIMSNEIRVDSNPDVMQIVMDNLIKSMALKLDLAFYEGAGTTEPTGLKNVSGITMQSMGANGAAPADLDPIADAIGTLSTENAKPTAIVMHPRSWSRFVKLKTGLSGDKTPLLAADLQDGITPRIYGIPVYLSGQLSVTETQGTSSVASSIYVYEADQIVAVRRSETRIEVDPYRLFNSDQTEVRAISRWDLVVPNPKAVVRIAGVL